MINRRRNSISSIFRRDTRFNDQVHFVMGYSQTVEFASNGPFLYNRMSNLACDTNLITFIWSASISTFCYSM